MNETLFVINVHAHYMLQIRDGFSGDLIQNQLERFEFGTTVIGTSNSVVLFLRNNANINLENLKIHWSGINILHC